MSKELDHLKKLKEDFSYYAPKLLKIRTKKGKLIDFKLNDMQRKIDATIEQLKLEGKPIRIMILKPRQGGASTYTEGRIFHSTSMNKLMNSMIVAHEEKASTNLFNMSKLYYDELPNEMKPMIKNSNSKELVFENPTTNAKEKKTNSGLRSKITITTAKNKGAGRSGTIMNLHASEVAFWDNPNETMLSLMQSVPNEPNTMVIVESTPNGVGGYFYEQWQLAKEGKSSFIPLFFAWFEDSEYEMDVPNGFIRTEEENELVKQYPLLTDRKLVWRRWCIVDQCSNDPEKFKQEYVFDDITCFLVSGRPKFDTKILMEYLPQCVDGERGYLEDNNGTIKFIPDDNGYIEIWKKPQKHEYFIGADVARGLEHGDYSAAPVFDTNYDLCALFHAHIAPDLYADELIKLATFYNDAMVAVEENKDGLTVITCMKNRYFNMYKRTRVDKISDEYKEELGWETTEQSKKLAINNLSSLIRERRLGIKSKRFIQECMTYVMDAKGLTNAQQGGFDDVVMGAAICLMALLQHGGIYNEIVNTTSFSVNNTTQQRYVTQANGYRKHISVIEDEEKQNDDGWGW